MQEQNNKDLYDPIDLNHIFNDDDILDEWIREGEELILSSDNLDWLNKGLPTNEEDRETIHEDDGATNRRISRCTSNATQERDIDSRHKGKAPRTIFSSFSSDDGDNEGSRRGGGTSGAIEELVVLVRVLEDMVALRAVMLVKYILTCHGHKEVKITMPHKIQIMDIDQGYGNNESIWKD